MPYTAGTQGADANCAKTFMEGALHTALTAVLTYVEERTNAAVVARVYKSPAANNSFGQDWFLVTHRSSDTATGVNCTPTEIYDTGAHVCKNYCSTNGSGTPTAQFAVNDATGKAPTDSANIGFKGVTISTSGFQYWLSVTFDRVVFATRVSTSDYAVYAGLYDDVQALTISPFPLFVLNLTGSSDNGYATREPNTTTAAGNVFRTGRMDVYTSPLTTTNDTYNGKAWLARWLISGRASSTNAPRGLLKDVWYCGLNGVNGDTLAATIGGSAKTLVMMRNANNTFIDNAL